MTIAELQERPHTEHDRVRTGLACTGLRAGYRDQVVVEDAAVVVPRGQVTALVGPNGSGKSTLLRSLARLHPTGTGDITLGDGTDARTLAPRDFAQRVTLLTQQRPTPGGLSVLDVVGYGRHPYRTRWGAGDADGARAVAWAMAVTGVQQMADRPIDALSGGELQRVWLATCLAQDTEVLLLDEPTNHLDLRYQMEVLDLVHDLAVDHGVAVGVVLHDLDQAASVADQVVLLDSGRVVAAGPAEQVLTEEHLTAAYRVRVTARRDPHTGALSLRPVGRHTLRRLPGARGRLPQP